MRHKLRVANYTFRSQEHSSVCQPPRGAAKCNSDSHLPAQQERGMEAAGWFSSASKQRWKDTAHDLMSWLLLGKKHTGDSLRRPFSCNKKESWFFHLSSRRQSGSSQSLPGCSGGRLGQLHDQAVVWIPCLAKLPVRATQRRFALLTPHKHHLGAPFLENPDQTQYLPS